MRRIIIILILISNYSFSQLTIDAGGDSIVLCQEQNFIPLFLGGNPTVTSGAGPFSYEWSIESPYTIPGSSITLHAADFLDDTTISNPIVIDGFGVLDSLRFFLKVTDGIGNIKQDSSMVYFSIYSITPVIYQYDILEGDSVYCNFDSYLNSSFAPHTYLWKPNHGLEDSTSLTFVAKPEYSIEYYLTITNSLGCSMEGAPVYLINVNHLGIEDILNSTKEVTIYPNPTTGEVFIFDKNKSVISILIYDLNENLISELNNNLIKYDLSGYPKGVYIFRIELEDQIITKKLILK
ncbi:hypothetical protein DNU06_16795 [Putridiphycobacter roseus]|uniref:Secretion system C-terminal sorting domain-containing protein n=1 Tax=Putridiphycobacter roseus TaxID=2219161 RepID=A0A2W1MWB0_9FLAO|nr:T9SS type A sorting domain-containing protein [Putridiphycobacter roseus]PZE15664.1 hypothetical protein DNU06_16795 [Putridiphycobacter roseus]